MTNLNKDKLVLFLSWATFFILLAILSSCSVTQRVPNKEVRASVKLGKHLLAVKKITAVYPNLIDSVSTPISVDITSTKDSTTSSFVIDSVSVKNALLEYKNNIRLKDSLLNIINNTTNQFEEDSLNHIKRLEELDSILSENETQIIKSIFKDTIFFQKKIIPIYINGDTLNLKLRIETLVIEGLPSTNILIYPIKKSIIVDAKRAEFTVYDKVKLPWWALISLGVVFIFLIIKLVFKR